MKIHHRVLLPLLLCMPLHAAVPTLIPRSPSVNVAREMVGWQELINRWDALCNYSVFTVTPEYTQTYGAHHIARNLFGDESLITNTCGATSINVSGSRVATREATDWLADYFGLPTDFESTLFIAPRIRTALVDFNYYQGLDDLICGLYFRIHAPVVHTHWNLGFTEVVKSRGSASYAPGYFNDTGVTRANLLPNATAFLSGAQNPIITDTANVDAQCFRSIIFHKLRASKIASDGCHPKGRSSTALSDIEAALGWNFVRDEDYLVGMSVRASFPTGTRITSTDFFAPVIGDGHHLKVGIGLNMQVVFWRSCDEQRSVGAFLDARAQHLLSSCQTRTFDLCSPNSRYMLAQKLGTTRLPVHIQDAANTGFEFQDVFTPVANLTTMPVWVKIQIEGDVGVKLAYMTPSWEFDLGYNYWGRTCENIKLRSCSTIPLADPKSWALKGDAHVIGFASGPTCVRLAAVEADATINFGTNNFEDATGTFGGVNGIPPTANPGITKPIELTAVNAGVQIDNVPVGGIPTRSSNPLTFITIEDVNLSGTKALSRKVFFHVNYTSCVCSSWTPFVGVGGEIEFRENDQPSACDDNVNCKLTCHGSAANENCQRCTLDQWGVWLKGGIAFN